MPPGLRHEISNPSKTDEAVFLLVQASQEGFDYVPAPFRTSRSVLRSGSPDGGRSVPIAKVFFGHDVGTGMINQDANIKVTAVENSHFAFHEGPAAGKHKSYAYRFETPDRVIVFTGDTGVSDAVTEFAKGADLLVSETSSCLGRMQEMLNDGRWQAMTPGERRASCGR
jgi:hypothetical protein